MLHLDMEKAKSLVDQAIAEQGEDHVYEKADAMTCLYVHGDEEVWDDESETYTSHPENLRPGCLVGYALNKGGIPLDVMYHSGANDEGSASILHSLYETGFLSHTEEASRYLANLQTAQDAGATWGAAREAALAGQTLEPERDKDGQPTGKFVRRDSFED